MKLYTEYQRSKYIPNIKHLDLIISDKKIFNIFPMGPSIKEETPAAGTFYTRPIIRTILVEGRYVKLNSTYESLALLVSDEKILKVFFPPNICLCKTSDPPRGGATFDRKTIIWTILVEVHCLKLNIKSLASNFRQEDIYFFFRKMSPCKTKWVYVIYCEQTTTTTDGDRPQ